MESPCVYTEELYDLFALQAVQCVQIASSVASVIIIFYTARRYLHRTIFENVTKELIIALYVFIVTYSLCVILTQGSQLTYRYLASTKCDAQVPKAWCIFRYILTVIGGAFATMHIGITTQHLLSSFRFSSRIQLLVARISILISVVYPVIYGVMAYHKDSLAGRTAYCSGITANSLEVVMFNTYLVLVLDVVNVLVSLLLWKYNVRMLKSEQSFDLSISFHRRQNLYAMRQFAPVAALQAVIYAVFFVTVMFTQSLQSIMSPGWYTATAAAANIIYLYCFLLSPIKGALVNRLTMENRLIVPPFHFHSR